VGSHLFGFFFSALIDAEDWVLVLGFLDNISIFLSLAHALFLADIGCLGIGARAVMRARSGGRGKDLSGERKRGGGG